MKKKPIFFFIVCVALISVLGVFVVGFTGHESGDRCPVTIGNGCSYMDNAFAMAMHHISGIKALAEATITYSSASIILIILSAVAFVSWFRHRQAGLSYDTVLRRYIFIRHKAHFIFKRILRWIALHNKLDTYFYIKASGGLMS